MDRLVTLIDQSHLRARMILLMIKQICKNLDDIIIIYKLIEKIPLMIERKDIRQMEFQGQNSRANTFWNPLSINVVMHLFAKVKTR